jgi:hypothetical protein
MMGTDKHAIEIISGNKEPSPYFFQAYNIK